MPRKVDPEHRRAKRQQITDAAAVLFARQGFDATTTAQICEAAGMSAGNVFHYFASKREILQVVAVGDPADDAAARTAAEAAADPWEGVLGYVDHLVAPVAVPGVPALVLEIMLQATRDPELEARLDEQDAAEQSVLQGLVARAADAGRVTRTPAAEVAASWVQTLIGSLYLRAATAEAFDPQAELPIFRLLLTRFLQPTEEPT